ncbi:DUF742 domain-containing protein [Streptomyces sp. NRRL F-5053]|uniref:DUF742 domain-containing protein n=1 Tax=Streptomyces sp. NRRL F-5053 TaxID=1463854 RepID=UPI0004C983A3|nr:DUF742 domain-containing protein [Streptomyces sp. NRRL F-5053]
MSWDPDVPDRSFVALGGRIRPDHDLDVVTLLVTERSETAGLGPEEATIVRLCAAPIAMVEIAALVGAPLGAVCVLLSGLLDRGYITARHSPDPQPSPSHGSLLPPVAELERVLDGLRKL